MEPSSGAGRAGNSPARPLGRRCSRRIFARQLLAGGSGLLAAPLLTGSRPALSADEPPQPKSIHTWLDDQQQRIYAYDVDIRITDFPDSPSRRWLYYFSLQVNFTEQEEWSHGGFQWSGTREFRDNNNKGVNWGGGAKWAGYGGLGVNNTPFTWELNRWYRYRAWRLNEVPDDPDEARYRWLFAVLDYTTGKELQFGTIRTRSAWIRNAVVFTETGYGVQCDTPQARVEWRKPQFRTTDDNKPLSPRRGTATYNGTCTGQRSTNQGLIGQDPLTWFHATHAPRETEPYQRLWDRG